MTAPAARPFLLACLGIVTLSGGSMAGIVLRTAGDSPPAGPVASGAPASTAPSVAPPPAAPPPAAMPAPFSARLPPDPLVLARVRREAISRSAISAADRVTRRTVRKALLSPPVQSRLQRCVRRDGGFGAARGPIPGLAPATLVLELERVGGELTISEVGLRRWGSLSREELSCARNALRGQVAAASAGPATGRTWMEFPLNPRSGVVPPAG